MKKCNPPHIIYKDIRINIHFRVFNDKLQFKATAMIDKPDSDWHDTFDDAVEGEKNYIDNKEKTNV